MRRTPALHSGRNADKPGGPFSIHDNADIPTFVVVATRHAFDVCGREISTAAAWDLAYLKLLRDYFFNAKRKDANKKLFKILGDPGG